MILKCIGKMLQDLIVPRQCLRLIEDGRVHWAGLILPSEHLLISAGSGMLQDTCTGHRAG